LRRQGLVVADDVQATILFGISFIFNKQLPAIWRVLVLDITPFNNKVAVRRVPELRLTRVNCLS